MIIGDHLNKNKFNIERFEILSAFANKVEISSLNKTDLIEVLLPSNGELTVKEEVLYLCRVQTVLIGAMANLCRVQI